MKKLIFTLAAVGTLGLLTACVAVPVSDVGVSVSGSTHGGYNQYPQGQYPQATRRDRDGDGVRNRNDRQPDNPYRY